jgi:putative redox protein
MIRTTNLDPLYQTVFNNGTHSAVADIPIAKGGQGQGYGPHELLEAALATCMSMTVQMYAGKQGFPLAGVTCKMDIDRSVPGQVTLNYALDFDGPLSDEQKRQLWEAARNCPVGRTLTGAIHLKAAIEER